jgi:hypothetical protein
VGCQEFGLFRVILVYQGPALLSGVFGHFWGKIALDFFLAYSSVCLDFKIDSRQKRNIIYIKSSVIA